MTSNFKPFFSVFCKGMAMGIADIIPGVSGGTIAFISGIYERFLNALKSFNIQLLRHLIQGDFRKAADHIDLAFLGSLLLGIFSGIALFSSFLKYMLESHPIVINAFFFGLIVGVSYILLRAFKAYSLKTLGWLMLGIVVSWGMINWSSFHLSPTPLGFFFAGFMAILAMILPGISGSLILYIIGMYPYVIGLVHELKSFNLTVEMMFHFGLFALGAVLSILSLSRFISFLYHQFTSIVTMFFTGFIIGSLSKIWPWHRVETSGENLLRWPQFDSSDHLYLALLCMALGVVVVMGIDRIEKRLKRKTNKG